MGDTFDSNGGEQNIGQGQNAVGKQVNNYFGLPLKPRTVFIASLAAAGVISASVVGYDYFARKPAPSVTNNSTIAPQSPAIIGNNATVNYGVPLEKYEQTKKDLDVSDAALASFFKILEQGKVPREDWGAKLPEIAFRYKELLQRFEAVTSDDPQVQTLKEQAKQAIENGDYDRADALLDKIDERHDNAIHHLHKLQAETAARLEKEQLGKAENLASKAKLQEMQYRYEKAAQYYQEAAAALPEGRKEERANYLGDAGYDLDNIAHYAEALHLYEQSLSISRAIGDREMEGTMLNNISSVYQMQSDYAKAFDYLEKSLPIRREIGDKQGEGTTLNNIATLAYAKGDYPKALKYFEQCVVLARETKDKEGEGITLNNIGEIYRQRSDYPAALRYYDQALAISREINHKQLERSTLNNISLVYREQGKVDAALEHLGQSLTITRQISERRTEGVTLNNIAMIYEVKRDYTGALKYYEQALAIAKEIGNKDGEATYSRNIGSLYDKQGELAKADQYISRAVELGTQLEHPKLKDWRKALEDVRAKLRRQQE